MQQVVSSRSEGRTNAAISYSPQASLRDAPQLFADRGLRPSESFSPPRTGRIREPCQHCTNKTLPYPRICPTLGGRVAGSGWIPGNRGSFTFHPKTLDDL